MKKRRRKPTTTIVPHTVSLLWIDVDGQLYFVKNDEPPIPVSWPDEDPDETP